MFRPSLIASRSSMLMERIVFLDRKTCNVEFRPPRFKHHWQDYDLTSPQDVHSRLQDATIAITNKVRLSEPELRGLPALRHIAVAATGVDCVDLAYCRQHGITVTNIPHYTKHSVPEHVFMLILALRRNLMSYQRAMQAGLWSKSPIFSLLDYPIHDIAGSILGVVGYGELGQAVAGLGRAFGMEVLVAERKHAAEIRPGRVPFDDVLKQSDVVTLHVPLTPATRQLIGSTELTRMKPTSLLINTARGGLLDETALASALQYGMIAGAGLDVLSQEPPPSDHPLLSKDLPNLIITPHVAWSSREAVSYLAEQLIGNLELFVEGSPRNVVL